MHLGPILVADNSDVGKNCVLHIHTGIVSSAEGECPVLGDDCWIGYGATIIGKTKLRNGVAVGAGSLVSNKEYPDNVLLVGVPAKILRQLK